MNGTSCFQEYTFTLSMNDTEGSIAIATGGAAPSGLCSDFLLFVDRERSLRLVNSNLGPKSSVPIPSWVTYEVRAGGGACARALKCVRVAVANVREAAS